MCCGPCVDLSYLFTHENRPAAARYFDWPWLWCARYSISEPFLAYDERDGTGNAAQRIKQAFMLFSLNNSRESRLRSVFTPDDSKTRMIPQLQLLQFVNSESYQFGPSRKKMFRFGFRRNDFCFFFFLSFVLLRRAWVRLHMSKHSKRFDGVVWVKWIARSSIAHNEWEKYLFKIFYLP